MGRSQQNVAVLVVIVMAQALVFSSTPAEAQVSGLDPQFYRTTCPALPRIVYNQVASATQADPRAPASLLRLQFHDCFVGGCDGSILLDAPAGGPADDTEKESIANKNSVRSYDVIDNIKSAVEDACPGVVSCADIVCLAALVSVIQTGGPRWSLGLGRRDSLVNQLVHIGNLISPDANISVIKTQYQNQNFTSVGAVALSGSHTIGLVRCIVLQNRLYNFNGVSGASDPDLNATLLAQMKALCPQTTDSAAGNVTQGLDLQTNQTFDNFYFQNLLLKNGKLTSDEQLLVGADDTAALVQQYADDQDLFFQDFADSMVGMGNLNVTTGTAGEVRLNCHVPNSANPAAAIKEVIERAREDSPMRRVFKTVVKKVVREMDAVATVGEVVEQLVEDTVDSAVHPSV